MLTPTKNIQVDLNLCLGKLSTRERELTERVATLSTEAKKRAVER
jgi:hypothetical protein